MQFFRFAHPSEAECPICGEEFEVETWTDGQCPECGNEYTWEEQAIYDDDGNLEDEWEAIEWEAYEPEEDNEDSDDSDNESM